MLNTVIRCSVLISLLAGCAHHGAVRVECHGSLRQINQLAPLKDAPVSVVPASPDAPSTGERQP